jgi:DNA repair protein RadC
LEKSTGKSAKRILITKNRAKMKSYKSSLPQITLKLKTGNVVKAQIKNSNDAAKLFRSVWDDTLEINESVICLFLNRNNVTIGWFKVSQGGISSSIVDNRLILATALKCLASGIILCHNHPSGNTSPSDSDIMVTKKLKEAAELFDIHLLDHIILTDLSHYSLADNGEI